MGLAVDGGETGFNQLIESFRCDGQNLGQVIFDLIVTPGFVDERNERAHWFQESVDWVLAWQVLEQTDGHYLSNQVNVKEMQEQLFNHFHGSDGSAESVLP
jgi:hypothetical protein